MISVDVYRRKANQFANDLTVNESVTTILEDTTEGWRSLSTKLKYVADMVPDDVYNDSTHLGKNDVFVEPFREALDHYKAMYSVMDWCRASLGGLSPLPDDPMSNKPHRQDVSFAEKVELTVDTKIIAVGDIHSGIHTFVQILDSLFSRGILKDDLGLSPGYHIIFLGDIVDRGGFGLDILHLIFRIKLRNTQSVHIINGNHEDIGMYSQYGFKKELESQLEDPADQDLVHNLLTYLPAVIFVQLGDEWIQFQHGGIDPDYSPRAFLESVYDLEFHGYDEPGNLKLMGLRWNDFNGNVSGTRLSTYRGENNTRVLEYGMDATEEYLHRNGIEGIIRGHQDFMSVGILPKRLGSVRDMSILSQEGMLYPDESHWIEKLGENNDWEHVSITNAFRDYSVFTTSTAVKNKGVSHHTYLEVSSTKKEVKRYQYTIRSRLRVYSEYARDNGVEGEFLHLVYDDITMPVSTHRSTDRKRFDRFVHDMKSHPNNANFPLLVLASVGSVKSS